MTPIVLASSNPGKLAEFNHLLADSGLHVVPQSAYSVEDVEETGLTFVENALLKARHASRISGLPALADDSGLCVEHLRGAPGLYSARYNGKHGDNAANNAKLLQEMRGVPVQQRGAFFICVLVLVQHAEDPAPVIAEGRWHGRVLDEERGVHGFGYDPLFLPDGETVSAAELPPGLKNRISHRARALAELRQRLATLHA